MVITDGEQTEKLDDEDPVEDYEDDEDDGDQDLDEGEDLEEDEGPVFSGYGIGVSTFPGPVVSRSCSACWHAHRGDIGERTYLSRVMEAAADWTVVPTT